MTRQSIGKTKHILVGSSTKCIERFPRPDYSFSLLSWTVGGQLRPGMGMFKKGRNGSFSAIYLSDIHTYRVSAFWPEAVVTRL